MIAADGGFTMRNRVINGCARIIQRGTASLTGSNQYGQVDRMIGSLAGSSVSGTLAQVVGGNAAGMAFKRGVGFTSMGFTSGYITFRHRIEALNTLDLSGQTVTVSAKVYHDYGSSSDVKIGLRKPSASDNFASTSTIGTDATVTVASATTTLVSATYTLGSTDADNGLEIVMYHDTRTVASKNFVIGDIELQLGSEVGPFERRSIGAELALCQRYYFKWLNNSGGAAKALSNMQVWTTGNVFGKLIDLPVPMRVIPTSATSSGGFYPSNASGSAVADFTSTNVDNVSQNMLGTGSWIGSTGLTVGYCSIVYAKNNAYIDASAEL